jgi:cytochrome c-type biogenesis protein CcmH
MVLLQILAIEPDNPRAKFYLALGQEQAGSQAEARSAFEAIARSSPADAPWLPLVNEHIAKNGGPITATGRKGSDRPKGERGLSTTQSPDAAEPQYKIQAMVESLDSRLRAEPNNFDGFMRLVRSYAVLNERTRAVDALQRGLAVFPATGEQGKQLVALARELGIERE